MMLTMRPCSRKPICSLNVLPSGVKKQGGGHSDNTELGQGGAIVSVARWVGDIQLPKEIPGVLVRAKSHKGTDIHADHDVAVP